MTAPVDGTPYAIINDAMHYAGYLQQGQTPNGEQLASNMSRLRDLINTTVQTTGLRLWLNVDLPITLVAGQAVYTFGPTGTVPMAKPLRVIEGYYLDANNVKRPLIPLAWDDKIRLGNETNTGPISQYFVDKQATLLKVQFWLVPDALAATGTAHLLLQVQAGVPVTLTEQTSFPVEWRMFLHWGLADEISTGQPPAIVTRCAAKAALYKDMLDGWDVEDAPTQFQPDSRSQYVNSRFR
jgi:hypothetical protein